MNKPNVDKRIRSYYAGKLSEHGCTPAGVDWNSLDAQTTRFQQIAQVLPRRGFSVLDFGCGYGALYEFLTANYEDFSYTGYDLAPEMVAAARERYGKFENARFTDDVGTLAPADYVVASGIFSVKMDVEEGAWREHILETIETMNGFATMGMSFNLLTAYADAERKRPTLYYADPHAYFDVARKYSKWVSLLHDYGIYEFTLLIRK